MANRTRRTPAALRSGIRAAAALDGIEVEQDPPYIEAESSWAATVGIRIASESDLVPCDTKWVVLIDGAYPFGEIRVMPAKDGGMTATFPHQKQNWPGPGDREWRCGKLCLDAPIERLGLVAGNSDPIGNRDERLRWHLLRAREWLCLASTGDLVASGDPFELPWCETKSGEIRLVHDESVVSRGVWEKLGDNGWGVVVWNLLPEFRDAIGAAAFEDQRGVGLLRTGIRYAANLHAQNIEGRETGFWWLWPHPIVVPPWHCPRTWGELRVAGREQSIEVDSVLARIVSRVRGKDSRILLLGYPIPTHRGERESEVHWQGVKLPRLRSGGTPAPGFRANEEGWWMRDRLESFSGDKAIDYVQTENWHPDRLLARGRLDNPVRSGRVALLGCGALGATIAELLVRGGVHQMLLVDGDLFTAGNLVRHTLTGADIGQVKAQAVATRLQSILPVATIRVHPNSVPVKQEALEKLLEDVEIVVDCTASNEVLLLLSQGWWSVPRLFVSAATGYKARRAFLYRHFGNTFDNDAFATQIAPWLLKERTSWAAHGETLEGAGCWSPLFPARYDDICLAAVACVKAIEEGAKERPQKAELLVFEQTYDDRSEFSGVHRVADSPMTGDSADSGLVHA